ncbi:hypothetical protein Tco_0361332, partial [Tanacetum coccineum]
IEPRRDLHFNDVDGITFLTNTEIFENLQLMGSKSTAWNEFGTHITSAVICLTKKQKFNFSKLIFDVVFNDKYDTPSHTKKVFANIRRKGKDFSGNVTPLFASKQGRNEIDQDEGISWFQDDSETQGRYGHDIGVNTASTSITTASINITTVEPVTTISAPITIAGVSVSTAEPSTPPTTTILIEDEDLIIAQTLMKIRSVKSKEKSKEKGVSSETATTTRGVTMQEPSESETRKIVPPPQHDLKDKGKAKMIKPDKPLKKKDQIKFDKEIAKRLAEKLQAELEEEKRVARQREEEANLIS